MVEEWIAPIPDSDQLVDNSEGLKTLAAISMHIESIGEGVKKIDRLLPGFLNENAPQINWKGVKGMRDVIAHGYFNVDADIVYDVAVNEIPVLSKTFKDLLELF